MFLNLHLFDGRYAGLPATVVGAAAATDNVAGMHHLLCIR